MKAYVEQINITEDGQVIVSGQLSRTNLSARLNEIIHITPPVDGIWSYKLEVLPTSMNGAHMMVPFSVQAPWIGDKDANGLRIIQPAPSTAEGKLETIQLKGKKVETLTTEQSNSVWLEGAFYDKATGYLIIDVKYSGGCFDHLFALEWDGSILKSNPPQYYFNLVDLSDYDPCKAMIPAQLRFDVSTPDFQIESDSVINIGTPKYSNVIRINADLQSAPSI